MSWGSFYEPGDLAIFRFFFYIPGTCLLSGSFSCHCLLFLGFNILYIIDKVKLYPFPVYNSNVPSLPSNPVLLVR